MKKKLSFLFTTVIIIAMILSVFAVNAEATLSLDKESYVVGDSVTITFTNGSNDPNAWIAISPAGVAYEAPGNVNKVWCYANSGTEQAGATAATEGTVTLNTLTSQVSLPAGEYKVTYFPDISYTVGVEKTFTITEGSNPATGDTFSVIATVAIVSMAFVVVLRRKAVVA